MTLCGRTKQHFRLHTDRFRIHRRTDPIGQADFFDKLGGVESENSMAVSSYVPPYSWLYFVGNKRSGGSENRAAASWAHEIMSALRRLFFFCRRPADCSVIKGLMFLDILKTIYK